MTHRILLADDSVTIRKVVELTFSDQDFVIDSVGDGALAFEHAQSERPDIIISDVIMPGLNGYELCQRIKSDSTLRSIPFLFLKGTFESFDEEKGRSCGANGFIVKPFESQELISRVKDLIAGASSAPPAPVQAAQREAPPAAPAASSIVAPAPVAAPSRPAAAPVRPAQTPLPVQPPATPRIAPPEPARTAGPRPVSPAAGARPAVAPLQNVAAAATTIAPARPAPPTIPAVPARPAPPTIPPVPQRPAPPVPPRPVRPVSLAPPAAAPPVQQPRPAPPVQAPAPAPPPVARPHDEFGFDFGETDVDHDISSTAPTPAQQQAPILEPSGESDEDLWSEVSLRDRTSDALESQSPAESTDRQGAGIIELEEDAAVITDEAVFDDESVFEEIAPGRVAPPPAQGSQTPAVAFPSPEVPPAAPQEDSVAPAFLSAVPGPASTGTLPLDDDETERIVASRLEAVVRKVLEPLMSELARTTIEAVAWEVIPELAETLIRAEIERVKRSTRTD